MITFRRFLESDDTDHFKDDLKVDSLKQFASVVSAGDIRDPPLTIVFDNEEYEWGMHIHKIHGAYSTTYICHLNDKYVRLVWLSGKKPCEIYSYDPGREPLYKDEIIIPADFVKMYFGNNYNKADIIRNLLKRYKETTEHDEEMGFEDTKTFLRSLIAALKDIGHDWPEIAAIEKSMK